MLQCQRVVLALVFVVLIAPSTTWAGLTPSSIVRGVANIDRLLTCVYNRTSGAFAREGLWQTANTLESIANYVHILSNNPTNNPHSNPSNNPYSNSNRGFFLDSKRERTKNTPTHTSTHTSSHTSSHTPTHTSSSPAHHRFLQALQQSFNVTSPLMDHCYDDWQWWLHAWVHVYAVDPDVKYLQRAADIYDHVSAQWIESECGGGVLWCPNGNYKNAITNELFLVSSMYLHPHATFLKGDPTYYLRWAEKEWAWFEQSGMVNEQHLINDGLDASTCLNNRQNTWTYNQGVILTGLALLANATGNSTLIDIAYQIAIAAMNTLANQTTHVLQDSCGAGGVGDCGTDGHLFKGIFIRHLRYFAQIARNDTFDALVNDYTSHNAQYLLDEDCLCVGNDVVPRDTPLNGFYSQDWALVCNPTRLDTATMSATIDALWAAGVGGGGVSVSVVVVVVMMIVA